MPLGKCLPHTGQNIVLTKQSVNGNTIIYKSKDGYEIQCTLDVSNNKTTCKPINLPIGAYLMFMYYSNDSHNNDPNKKPDAIYQAKFTIREVPHGGSIPETNPIIVLILGTIYLTIIYLTRKDKK